MQLLKSTGHVINPQSIKLGVSRVFRSRPGYLLAVVVTAKRLKFAIGRSAVQGNSTTSRGL